MTTENRELPSIDINRFLTLAVNMLDSYFFKSTKEKARKLYKELERGGVSRKISRATRTARWGSTCPWITPSTGAA